MTNIPADKILRIVELEQKLSPDTVHAVRTFMTYLSKENVSGIVKVLLYGSRARGEDQPDSDIDMAVVFAGPAQDDAHRYLLQRPLSYARSVAMRETDSPITISAVALWEEELLQPEKQKNPRFYRNVMHDGIDAEMII